MFRDEKYPDGRIVKTLRVMPRDATSIEITVPEARALMQELAATRLHLALVANEHGNPPESARALARAFLNERFPGAF